jgi:CheY-like chemotaxis protein
MREYVARLLGNHFIFFLILRIFLEPYYRVEAVADGQEALESAIRNPPDLVLSDIMMPRLDGIGLLKGRHPIRYH